MSNYKLVNLEELDNPAAAQEEAYAIGGTPAGDAEIIRSWWDD